MNRVPQEALGVFGREPAQPVILLAPGQVVQGRPVGMKAAHRELTRLRTLHHATMKTTFLHDLTAGDFDWKVWIYNRTDRNDIIDGGIWAFDFIWVDAEDSDRFSCNLG